MAEAIGAAVSGGWGTGSGYRKGSASFGTATEASLAIAIVCGSGCGTVAAGARLIGVCDGAAAPGWAQANVRPDEDRESTSFGTAAMAVTG
jgi:hypothetical protein